MVPDSNQRRVSRRAATPTYQKFAQQCSLCGGLRSRGGLLASRPGTAEPMLWVCHDCQHKLARGVDDEGALGG